jgi:hypothetical protein
LVPETCFPCFHVFSTLHYLRTETNQQTSWKISVLPSSLLFHPSLFILRYSSFILHPTLFALHQFIRYELLVWQDVKMNKNWTNSFKIGRFVQIFVSTAPLDKSDHPTPPPDMKIYILVFCGKKLLVWTNQIDQLLVLILVLGRKV